MKEKIVTYSPAYTLVPTYECFNRCSYCNFRVNPQQDEWLSLKQARERLKQLENQKISEILILSGEVHPKSPRRLAWLQLIYDLCELALSLGFLPHTNVGPLSFQEMEKLKQVNVSMGLMLEQLTPKLLNTVHKQAPSKVPNLRLQQLEWAGELGIPFTTGLLLGIGETKQDSWETLEEIASHQRRWGNIQEVILQPHSHGSKQSLEAPGFDPWELIELVAKARFVLPETITIQIPPNLIPDSTALLACIEAGARDLGGIGPIDEVNPDFPHHQLSNLRENLAASGWQLVPRLPIYPQYDSWLPQPLQSQVSQWRVSIF